MQDAEDFDAFVAIVDAGSISEAARGLAVPRATLSRQLARLEDRLGVRLLHRSTRSLVPTPAGEALYPRARSLVDGAKAAVDAVQRLDDVPRGLLRVSSAPLHTPALGALMAEFAKSYPNVQVELQTSTRHIDLVSEQVDVAIRGGVVRDPNLIARNLFRTDLVAIASPAYFDTHGRPQQPDDLARHACLRGFEQGTRPVTAWPLRDSGTVRVDGPLVTNDLMALLGAAKNALGIALLPRELVQPEIDSEELLTVMEGIIGLNVTLSLVWVEQQFLDPKIRAFIDMASAWFADTNFGAARR